MAGQVNAFRDDLAKPVIELSSKELMSGAGHLLRHYGRRNSSAIERGIELKKGNIFKFKLPQYGGEAGEGYNLHRNATTAREHAEITTFGHLNYGADFSMYDTTYETMCNELRQYHAMNAGDAMARKAVARYMNELVQATNFVAFNPGNPGASLLALRAKMRRAGDKGKPNIVTSTGMWTAIENVKHANTHNDSINANMSAFNMIEDVNGLPTYKTGDRTGLCLQVYTGCQAGCKIYISGGVDAAGRMIIAKGETLEICGVKSVDMLTHISRGERRQFVAQCDVWADATGKAVVHIEPELLPLNVDYGVRNTLGQEAVNGGRKNVDRSPADAADVYVSPGLQPNSEYEQSIIWYDEMMAKIAPNISQGDCGPDSEMSMAVRSKVAGELGRMLFMKQSNIQNRVMTFRWDYSIDYINIFPELGYRLVGNKIGNC